MLFFQFAAVGAEHHIIQISFLFVSDCKGVKHLRPGIRKSSILITQASTTKWSVIIKKKRYRELDFKRARNWSSNKRKNKNDLYKNRDIVRPPITSQDIDNSRSRSHFQ